MKHRIRIRTVTEKRTLFGKKKIVSEKTVEVDGKTYRKIMKEKRERPYTPEELALYDIASDED